MFLSQKEVAAILVSAGIGVGVGCVAAYMIRRFGKKSGMLERSQMQLYHTHTYRSARCLWLVEEMGARKDFEIINYNPNRETRERIEWYKDNIHPHGTVPALVIEGEEVMVESGAINLYLAELYNRLLPPKGEWPNYISWSVYAVATVDPCLQGLYYQYYGVDDIRRNQRHVDELTAKFHEFASKLSEHLQKRTYICGDNFTAADVNVGYSVMWASVIKGGALLQDYPFIRTYLNHLKARPAFKLSMGTAREWLNAPLSWKN